ncbi:MAG: hypothetical protein LBT65_01395 [Synergistaceae bacterium]|nr:hypothetical protein [Synergistaceae bacterium]
MRLFRRPFVSVRGFWKGGPSTSRHNAERRDDGPSDRGAEERFEFKKRHSMEAGSMGYIWRTANDGRCPQHKKLEGRFIPWDNPPLVDDVPVHAGERADCSCTTEIVY